MAFLSTTQNTGKANQTLAELYWSAVGATAHQLRTGLLENASDKTRVEDSVFITSLDLPLKGFTPGSVCDMTTEMAARRIVDATHRLALPEEIAGFKAGQDSRLRMTQVQDRELAAANGRATAQPPQPVFITPETLAQMGYAPVKAKTAEKGGGN